MLENTIWKHCEMKLQWYYKKMFCFLEQLKKTHSWGNKEASDEEIVEACKLAQADEFIQRFPDKYDTYIEQGGTNVSGGQKQRLCINKVHC